MQIRFNVIDITRDRRTPAQRDAFGRAQQAAADRQLEREFEARVARNVATRRLRAAGLLP